MRDSGIYLQWLEVFAKNHEFCASFLLHYKLKNHLENNQHYWLQLYINQAEENGDILLIRQPVISCYRKK